jgi:hypothetical protein
MESGDGVLVAAFPGFTSHLRFDQGRLAGLSYEPSFNTPQWGLFEEKARTIREVRTLFSSAAVADAVRLDALNGLQRRILTSSFEYEDGIDLTTAILVAYGYFAIHRDDIIPAIWSRVLRIFRSAPLDISMLLPAKYAALEAPPPSATIPFPLLTQGWSLMRGLGRSLPQQLKGLDEHLLSSPWTQFDEAGVKMIAEFLANSHVSSGRQSRVFPGVDLPVDEYVDAETIVNEVLQHAARLQEVETIDEREEEAEGFADA